MGETLEDEKSGVIETIARRNEVPIDAVETLIAAIRRGGGRQAQFSHPALGGMGQWSRDGGIMIGDMFNHSLKAKVEQLCTELAGHVDGDRHSVAETSGSGWWPSGLGQPSAVGSQNDESYACFPHAKRLAVRDADGVRLYDTGTHRISGVSQQQGSSHDLSFTSQHGTVLLSDLRRVQDGFAERRQTAHEPCEPRPPIQTVASAPRIDGDVIGLIERLYELQRNGVLTAEEFAAKKTELLARL